MNNSSYYEAPYLINLFDEMSTSYGRMNTITSFGFYPFWRYAAVRELNLKNGDRVTDLMTGAGESWKHILKRIGPKGTLTAIDFSPQMIKEANKRKPRFPGYTVNPILKNVFNNNIPSNSQNAVICTFGLKTLSFEQIEQLAKEIERILNPNGQFSIIEVALPENKILRHLYFFYISRIIPLLALLFAADKKNYTMLGVYTKNQKDPQEIISAFKSTGVSVKSKRYFFGCAYGIYGRKL